MLLWTACYFGKSRRRDPGCDAAPGCKLSAAPCRSRAVHGRLAQGPSGRSAIFIKGILANWIVCLAVRIALRCQDEVAKILILILVVFIFVYLGFEHSIANMGTFSMAILGGGECLRSPMPCITCSTARNVVGGALLAGLPFIYLNPAERDEQLRSVN